MTPDEILAIGFSYPTEVMEALNEAANEDMASAREGGFHVVTESRVGLVSIDYHRSNLWQFRWDDGVYTTTYNRSARAFLRGVYVVEVEE